MTPTLSLHRTALRMRRIGGGGEPSDRHRSTVISWSSRSSAHRALASRQCVRSWLRAFRSMPSSTGTPCSKLPASSREPTSAPHLGHGPRTAISFGRWLLQSSRCQWCCSPFAHQKSSPAGPSNGGYCSTVRTRPAARAYEPAQSLKWRTRSKTQRNTAAWALPWLTRPGGASTRLRQPSPNSPDPAATERHAVVGAAICSGRNAVGGGDPAVYGRSRPGCRLTPTRPRAGVMSGRDT